MSGYNMKVYAGFNKNKEIINSASGGIAIALYEHCIANKFIVVGAKYTEDMYNAEYDFASDILDICKFQGSKYFFVKKIIFVSKSSLNFREM